MSWIDQYLQLGTRGPAGPAGSGGGTANIISNYTQPSIGSTVDVILSGTSAAVVGKGAEVAGGGFYTVTALSGSTATLLNGTSAVNAGSGSTILAGTTVTFGGNGAPLAATARLNGQTLALVAGIDTPQGHKAVHHFASYGASTSDSLNAPRFEAMLTDANSDGLDMYAPSGQYGTNRPVFWPYPGCRLITPKCDDVTDPRAFQLLPKYTISATDWTGPTLVMGPTVPEPGWTGPDAHGMYGLPLANPEANEEPNYVALGQFDALSLKGVGAIALDIKYFHPTGGNGGASYAIFFAGGGSVSPNVTYTLFPFVDGTDQVHVFGTTDTGGFFSIISTTGNKLNQNAWNDIRISYDGTSWRIFINGILDTTHGGNTGNLTVDPFFRMFLGVDSGGGWLADSTGDGPVHSMGAQLGAAIGDFMISFCGTPVTGSSNYTPANRYVRDDVSTWTPPGLGHTTNGTGVLINYDVANRGETVASNSNASGWVVAQCNVRRSDSLLPRNPGNTVWLRCGGRVQEFIPYNAIHDAVFGGPIGLDISCCPFTRLQDVTCLSYSIACALTNFSYFSQVVGGKYTAQFGVTDPGLYTGDYWGLALLSEGARVDTVQANGGNAAIVGSGNIDTCYVDIGGYFGVVMITDRVSDLTDAHIYNEGAGSGFIALLACVNVACLTVNSALIGTVGSAVPAGVAIYGGDSMSFNGITFSSLTAGFSFLGGALATPVTPLSPIVVVGAPDGGGTPWLDVSNQGFLLFPQNRGISPVATSSDANRTVTDHEFFAGYTIKLTGANWTAGHNLALPYCIEGDERIVHNTEAHTATITPGSVTVATNAYARVIANGSTWVTAP